MSSRNIECANVLLSKIDIETLMVKGRLVKCGGFREDEPIEIRMWYVGKREINV